MTMATWKNDKNEGAKDTDVGANETVVTSHVVTVHVTGSNGSTVVNAVDIDDTTVTLVLELGSSADRRRYARVPRVDTWIWRKVSMSGWKEGCF